MSEHKPYVPAETSMADWSWRGLVFGIIFGAILGSANAYLGLKVGLTISTSIPLTVIMVAVFAAMKKAIGKSTILDVNIGQTAGSASSSMASGIIFTIPALFMWGFAPTLGNGFLQVALLAMCGGILGILFMIPLRPFLIVQEHKNLPYPEGTACAAVLIAADEGGSKARPVFLGLAIGTIYKGILSILKLWPSEVDIKIPVLKKGILGFEPTPALLGVGYVLGYRIAAIMVAGGLLSWLGIIPLIAIFGDFLNQPLFPELFPEGSTIHLVRDMEAAEIWSRYVRYIGAGAVATAGIIAVIKSLPVMFSSIKEGLRGLSARTSSKAVQTAVIRTSRDLPMSVVVAGVFAVVALLAIAPGIIGGGAPFAFRAIASICIVIFAFLFVTVSSRIVGLVGVTSNPTSGMAIVTLIGTSILFYSLGWTDMMGKITVLTIGTVVCVAASMAGDISQDLKTGYLIGAKPSSQQTAELTGVIVNASIIAGVVLLLGNQYGFGGTEFPAPQATLMKTVVDGVLDANLPWGLVLTGASFSIMAELLGIPSLAFAVGIYLPLSTITPVFIGGCVRSFVERKTNSQAKDGKNNNTDQGILLASGLIAGEGLMGIGVAVAALILGSQPQGIGIAFEGIAGSFVSLGVLLLLGIYLYRTGVKK